MAPVALRRLRKRYGSVEAVKGIDLEIGDREFVVLVGASGCGKSTTLRMIAGLEDISQGEIWIGDRLVNELEPKDRDIAMVFQDYALYPHLTVAENIGFGLRYRGHRRAEIGRRVGARALDAVSLGTTSCNMGNANLNWIQNTVNHPLIGGALYKYKVVDGAGRLEQLGLGWVKHAFAAFQEAGLENLDRLGEVGRRFRDTVLSLGGGKDPADVFRAFRGRDPDPKALLRAYGLAA